MEWAVALILMFFGFKIYEKMRRRADGRVLVSRAHDRLDRKDLQRAQKLILKARRKGVQREKLKELTDRFNSVRGEIMKKRKNKGGE